MQYELRYQTLEPRRQTFQYLIDRYGDQPASRYVEATVDVEPTENFHYRPTWAPGREIYDERFSALRLTDPYVFLDPRQYYYTPYVTARAAHHDEFGKTLAYVEQRNLLASMPDVWRDVVGRVVIPLRHYESGAQLVTVAGARFAHGTSIEQCCTFAAFDRIGNAQMLSRIGIALGGGTADVLQAAKQQWMEATHLQPLRELIEEAMVTEDWAEGVLAVDLVDSLLYPLLYAGLDDAALLSGAGAYSLLGQHFTTWYADQRKWLDALSRVWVEEPEHGPANAGVLREWVDRWLPTARAAAGALAAVVDGHVPAANANARLTDTASALTTRWTETLGGTA